MKIPDTRITSLPNYRGPIPDCVILYKHLVIDILNQLLTIPDYQSLYYNNERYNGICSLLADALEVERDWPYTQIARWIMIAGYIGGYQNAGRMCPERRQLILDLLEELQ